MEFVCAVCGGSFVAKRKNAKYCSKACANRSDAKRILNNNRYDRPRAEINADIEKGKSEVLRLYEQGFNDVQISKKIGRSASYVNDIRKRAGLPKQLTKRQREILTLRKRGLCCSEIVDITGYDNSDIHVVCDAIGMPFTDEEKERSIRLAEIKVHGTAQDIENRQRDYIAKHLPGWSWVSGLYSCNGFVEIRHECGKVIKRSATSIRHNKKPVCPVCAEIERSNREKEHQEAKERQRIEAKKRKEIQRLNKFWQQGFKQQTMGPCEECGNIFIGRGKYCSDECRKKVNNRRGDKRITKDMVVDANISLEKLYKRDGGICWLCGERCDYCDCETDEQGNFIAGKQYPSIDHVKPISKGGLHSWDNVRLAHFYCNTLKSDKVIA